jgi:hypothetical protein
VLQRRRLGFPHPVCIPSLLFSIEVRAGFGNRDVSRIHAEWTSKIETPETTHKPVSKARFFERIKDKFK